MKRLLYPKIILISYVFSITCVSGHKATEQLIFNGYPARPGQFPYQIAMDSDESFCGGSIIGKRWILTAAHCLSSNYQNDRSVKVYVGTNDVKRPRRVYKIEKIIRHPDYTYLHSSNYGHIILHHDVALLKTDEDIIYDEFTQPIKLSAQSIGGDVKVTVSGWGQTNRGRMPCYLQWVNLNTITDDHCQRIFQQYSLPSVKSNDSFCTLNTGPDVGQGDSGGPLVYNGEQVGIVCSVHIGLALGFNTRVANYIDWIHEKMETE